MRLVVLPLLLAACIALAPLSAYAAEATFLGPIVPPECNCEGGERGSSAADYGCVLQTVQNAINFAVTAGLFILIIYIAWAGFLFVISPANPENRTKARQLISNALLGMALVLCAWLLVDFVMKIVYNPDTQVGGRSFGPWNEILRADADQLCLKVMENPPALPGVIGGEPSGPVTTPVTGGKCSVPTSGNCSPQALAVFGSAANEAAQICNAESRGVIRAVSTTDVMRNDPKKRAFSFGLFQINLTYHNVGGNECPKAFRGKNYTATVINESLYARCVAAAQTASANIAEALATYKRTGWKEWSTAKGCGLAVAFTDPIAFLPGGACDARGVSSYL